MTRPILLPHRLRQIERPFGWIPLSLLREGHFGAISTEAKVLYCLLCIVSDRRGISFYGDAKLLKSSGLCPQALERARCELVRHDLIAVDSASPTVQVLSLPAQRQDLARRQGVLHKAPGARSSVPPPAAPPPNAKEQLLAVRQLIQTLTHDKRRRTTRSSSDATQD